MNGGFEAGTDGAVPTGWTGTGTRVSPPTEKVHGGLFIGGVPVFGAARLDDGEFLCQAVAVQPGCCYTFTGAYEVTGGGANAFGVANVQFISGTPTCRPPLIGQDPDPPNLPPSGNHFLIPGPTAGPVGSWQTFTVVACAPDYAEFACICFVNLGITKLLIDSVRFFATGGPCDTCTGNP